MVDPHRHIAPCTPLKVSEMGPRAGSLREEFQGRRGASAEKTGGVRSCPCIGWTDTDVCLRRRMWGIRALIERISMDQLEMRGIVG